MNITVSTGQLQFQVYKCNSGCWGHVRVLLTDKSEYFLGNFRFFAAGIVLFRFWSFRFLFLLLTPWPITIKQFFSLLIERIMTFNGTCCYFLRSDSGWWATFSKTFLQMRRESKSNRNDVIITFLPKLPIRGDLPSTTGTFDIFCELFYFIYWISKYIFSHFIAY